MKGIDCKFILNLMMKTSLNFKRFSSLKVFYFTVDSNKENFRQKYMKFENFWKTFIQFSDTNDIMKQNKYKDLNNNVINFWITYNSKYISIKKSVIFP